MTIPADPVDPRRDHQHSDDRRDDATDSDEQVSQVAEPTTEQRPGELPDESQGPP